MVFIAIVKITIGKEGIRERLITIFSEKNQRKKKYIIKFCWYKIDYIILAMVLLE